MSRCVVFAAVFSIAIAGVLGLARNCYLCNSYADSDNTACVDPMSPYPQVNHTFCPDQFVCTRVSYITQKTFVVERGCDPPENTCDNIYQELESFYPNVASFVCYACKTDYCNGASG